MKFTFVCHETNETFQSSDFGIIEDKGVSIDDSGNKVWDAKVELTLACPFCGKRHVFDVSELPCPSPKHPLAGLTSSKPSTSSRRTLRPTKATGTGSPE